MNVKSMYVAAVILSSVYAAACQPPEPRRPWTPQPHVWDQPNPQCPGTASIVAYCCSCSPVDEQIKQRMLALDFSGQLSKGVEQCVSSELHEWRKASEGGAGDGATSIVDRCTKAGDTRDPNVMQALVQIVRDVSAGKPDATWEVCYADTISRGTCSRIEEALKQERAEHDQRMADEQLEYSRQMETQRQQTENLSKIFSGMIAQAPSGGYYPGGVPWGNNGGIARIGFVTGGEQYTAVVEVRGTEGYADVTRLSSHVVIREDLRANMNQGVVLLVGSNPRDTNGRPALDYAPDTFQMVQVAAGQWQITTVCDTQGSCVRTIQIAQGHSMPVTQPTVPRVPASPYGSAPDGYPRNERKPDRQSCYSDCDLKEIQCDRTCRVFGPSNSYEECSRECKTNRHECNARCRD